MAKKQVMLVIEVPEGKYCWNYSDPKQPSCWYFDNEGGYRTCDLPFFCDQDDDGIGVLKPKACAALHTVTD